MQSVYEVIHRVVLTEKSYALSELGRKYVFEVALQANKYQIKEAVQQLYAVRVQSVNTSIVHGKVKRRAGGYSQPKNWKKAIVTLQEGQQIDLTQG